jgi:hypothetical protein
MRLITPQALSFVLTSRAGVITAWRMIKSRQATMEVCKTCKHWRGRAKRDQWGMCAVQKEATRFKWWCREWSRGTDAT